MLVSLVIYLCGARTLPADERPRAKAVVGEKRPLHAPERRSVLALIGICALVTLFWAAYDQQGNTIVLWAENFTDRSIDLLIWQGEIPSPWFLALNPLMIIWLTPFIVRLWARQGQHGTEPAPVSKMAFGCLCVALANVVMAAAAWTNVGKASPLWLVGYFVLATIGELYLAPVGLALISKMAPTRMLSMMMGVWFATTLPADILAGFLGGFWSRMAKPDFFLMIAVIPALAGAAMWAFQKLVVRNLSASRGPGA
jgi:POT family proton-dependent oligopeptide transporter